MGKVFNLKEWLRVPDTARHLSISFCEEVTEADVLRLALDGRLRLSAYFVNRVRAQRADVFRLSESEWAVTEAAIHRRELSLYSALPLGDGRYLKLNDRYMPIKGVWDLPLLGNERRDVERKFQLLTAGPAVESRTMLGTLLGPVDGEMLMLNAFNGQISAELGLPKDCILVVRTDAIRDFEKSTDGVLATTENALATASRAHVSDKLARMNQAAPKFWGNADRDDRGTHPSNATVAAWLVQQGFSSTLADAAASIIQSTPHSSRTNYREKPICCRHATTTGNLLFPIPTVEVGLDLPRSTSSYRRRVRRTVMPEWISRTWSRTNIP